MRGIFRRATRLQLIAGLGITLAVPALAAANDPTTTTLTETSTQANEVNPAATCTLTSLAVTVADAGNAPAAGIVAIEDEVGGSTVQLGSATLNSAGKTSFSFDLPAGTHSLSAVYAGNAAFVGSASAAAAVTIDTQCSTEFIVALSNVSPSTASSSAPAMSLTPGLAGSATITIAPSPDFIASLTANGPAYITISCSGLSDLATCAFTPENVEILPGQSAAVTSSMVIQTFAASTTRLSPPSRPGRNSPPVAWAFLLPGLLGLGGLAWGARRKAWLKRLSLAALLSLVTLLGATGCNPRYAYENHSPEPNPATPAGTYTVKIAAQFSNGVASITGYTDLSLTVK